MKRANILPNVITAFGLACGLFVIFRVSLAALRSYELLEQMTFILLLAGLADLLDGAIARAIKGESEFGVVFDSLADAISFGVAPAVLFLKAFALPMEGALSFFALAGAMLYTMCGVLRLVRFNIKDSKAKEEENPKKTFIGLPIPAAAAAVVAPNLFLHSPFFQRLVTLTPETSLLILSSIMVVVGYLMVSRIRFPSLKTIHVQTPSFYIIVIGIFLFCLTLYGFLYYLSILLLIAAWGYIFASFIFSVISFLRFRKQSR